jgi:NitT/TauT family transport system ATP-binding protein
MEFTNTDGGQDFQALRDINLRIEKGSFVCLVGPSGCGKSTVLNLIAGLLQPTEGAVLCGDREVKGINTSVGYLTQHETLLPWRHVDTNVGLALEIRHLPQQERREQVAKALESVGLSGYERFYPSQLSGGMRKRAALARTLIYEPETLLMDEPYGAIDAIRRSSLHDMLLKLWADQKLTVVFVTHDLEEALLLADQVVVFGAHPGRIVHVQKVPFARPRNLQALRAEPQFTEMWESLWAYLDSGQQPMPARAQNGT